ncbi:glycosyltransferase family 39 protein [Mycolicibacterium sp. P1-18]|uniref:ArnT family glycosyltransferase n=1 Tax=Mycolicibacterium sp. P1-18 TaxID=2024615 RepID=UPI001F5BD97E|nr:glycosyltransferase family 39 protein [Mycolicibacterium sp. P1-18]
MTTTLELPIPASDETTDATPPRHLRDRVAFGGLLLFTAVVYLWNITVNGMGNQFYAAAAQAGSQNWEALLFGSLDTQNFMTVDKPPVSQWVMGLSGQIFGFSSASMLVPEALMAVATAALLYAAVRRISGPNVALLAGFAFAMTPVAALMFRFNNPDAVMVLLMTAAAYCAVRALERASATWIAMAGVALGFAFLAKMLEGIMVMPAIGLAYLVAAPTSFGRRVLHLVGALGAFLLSAGWFVLLTLLWPASSRPYIAGSTDDNFMNLVLGYNGFARVLGKGNANFHLNPVVGAAADTPFEVNHGHHGGFGGMGANSPGLTRLFTGEFGVEIGWLLPAALLALVLVLVLRFRAPRTDLVRAGAVVFGAWMLVDGLVLSYMKSMVHPYYCLSFVPAVGGMVALGVGEAWSRRESWLGRGGLVVMILGTGVWSWWLLGRNADWMPVIRWTVLALAVVAAVGLAVSLRPRGRRHVAVAALALGLFGGVLGTGAYSVATLGQPHTGGMPMVGPASPDGRHGGWDQDVDNAQLDAMLRAAHTDFSAAVNRSSAAAGLELSTDTAVMAIGGFGGSDPAPTLGEFQQDVANHRIGYYVAQNDDQKPGGFGGRAVHPDIATWVAAHFTPTTVGSDTVYDLTAPAR